jgi:hypothetical protein
MADPAFPVGTKAPKLEDIPLRVGKAWDLVVDAVDVFPHAKANWKQSKTSGWYLTFDIGAKRLFYCFPQQGDLLLKVVYNDKGVAALRGIDGLKDLLDQAKKYAEGTLLEFTSVELEPDLLTELLRIKAASIR